jgi:predicted secreted protein
MMSESSKTIAQSQNKTPKKTGKPSSYSKEIAQEICERLSDGEPLRQICRSDGMPAWRTVYDWIYKDDALGADGTGLSTAIAHARDVGYDAIAEDLLNIADTPLIGEEETSSNNGLTITRKDMLGHRKLQIETRLKLLAKWNPKKYGDRQILSGDADNPLVVDTSFFQDLANKFEDIKRKGEGK